MRTKRERGASQEAGKASHGTCPQCTLAESLGWAEPPAQSGCRRGLWPDVLLGQMPFAALMT